MRFGAWIFTLALCAIFAVPVMAQETDSGANTGRVDVDYSAFSQWPVLHDGRIKTMESFSRSVIYILNGDTTIQGMSPVEWVVQALFEPFKTVSMPTIRVGRSQFLDLPDRDDHAYSLNELMIAMRPMEEQIMLLQRMDPSTLSASQKDILTVYNAMVTQTQLIQSFGAILPLAGYEGSYSDGAGSTEQRALIRAAGQENQLLKIIPDLNNPNVPMMTLWDAYQENDADDQEIIQMLKDMAAAWNEADYATWEHQSVKVGDKLYSKLDRSFLLELETVYTSVNPIYLAFILYAIGAVVILKYRRVGMTVLYGGLGMQIFGLVARSVILQRPPTGTIYETLLFAALIIMITACVYFYRRGHPSVIAGWAAASSFLLFIAQGFVGGDSLNVLIAVLNTNFWLSTHVTCIIIGYALCIMAAMIGHLYLVQPLDIFKRLLMPMTLFALLFTAVGTLLGGIWADQSWGRFWGWDPKENGALLITLWLIWVVHGRISKHFNVASFAAILGLTNIMVALTWFGVNLLGVGLHSYGFISGVAYGLGAFCVMQLLIIGGLYWRRRRLDA